LTFHFEAIQKKVLMSTRPSDTTRPPVHLRIGSTVRTTGSGGTYDHIDPTTGQVDATIPMAGPAEVDEAVAVADEAFHEWKNTRPAQRARLLSRLADVLEENRDELIRRAVLDNGMPVRTAELSFQLVPEWIRYYAGFADKIEGRVATAFGPDGEFGYSLAQPYGVIGAITTWNAPLASIAMKVPAALAAGNTVVIKPPEVTPFAPDLFGELAEVAGFPSGVINVVPGSVAAASRLVEHPKVQKITFTGGPATARAILRTCAELIKPVVMELGGKSANLIFEDADLESAIKYGTLRVLGLQAGQGCGFPTRMLVQRSVYEEVLSGVVETAEAIKVGNPWDPTTDVGPVINAAAVDRILGMIERAERDGAKLVTGGGRVKVDGFEGGYFLQPTVFADVDPQSELAQTEVFGPVLAVMPFEDEKEAIEIANSTKYGLTSYVQTNDLRRAHRVAEQLVAGGTMIGGAPNVHAQRPFGGVGISGFGKEGGPEGIAEFLRVKAVAIV
jgi:aldehyde dehydrogenase (NAD+)